MESRLTRPSLGRLGGGVAQVPAPPDGRDFLSVRQALPIWPHRSSLVSAVGSGQVVLITGDTGSGKTTQVIQYLLEEAAQKKETVR